MSMQKMSLARKEGVSFILGSVDPDERPVSGAPDLDMTGIGALGAGVGSARSH